MKKRFLASVMTILMLVTLLAGCGGGDDKPAADTDKPATEDTGSAEAEYKWRMSLNNTKGELAYDMGAYFAEKVNELTGGKVEVELFGGAALGTTTEVLEGMSAGVADVLCESVGTLAPFTELANIDAMPYMYTGYDHFAAVWSSEVGADILQQVGDAANFKLMGSGYRGARVVTATKKMETVDEFKGFKLRAPNLEMYVKTWQWMDAAPTPLAMGEVYTALQQGTVEGQENSIMDSKSYSIAEVCKEWILTNHVYSSNTIIMDKGYFDSLPADIQAAVEEAAAYAGEKISQDVLDREEAAKAELEAEGVNFTAVDNAAFSAAFDGFAEEHFPYLADWTNQIRAMAP